MPSWTDTFNRADGPIGGDWSVQAGTWNVSSNHAQGSSGGAVLTGQITGPGSAVAEAAVSIGNDEYNCVWVAVKCTANMSQYIRGRVYNSGSNLVCTIAIYGQTGGTYTLVGGSAASGTIRLEYNAGVSRLYFDGTQYVSVTNSAMAANAGIGLFDSGGTCYADSFTASGDGEPQLIVSPRVIGTDDG